jgi:hypothetical protein
MVRRRTWLVLGARLSVYVVAMVALLLPRAAEPAPRLAFAAAPEPVSLLLPTFLLLVVGVLLEVFTGVLRCR